MGKVDCIVEMRKEAFHEGMLEAAKNFLMEGISIDVVSKCTGLSIDETINLKKKLNIL